MTNGSILYRQQPRSRLRSPKGRIEKVICVIKQGLGVSVENWGKQK